MIPYCPVCWGSDEKLIPLAEISRDEVFQCPIHRSSYYTAAYYDSVKRQATEMMTDSAPGGWMR
jgi:hypothetical protein